MLVEMIEAENRCEERVRESEEEVKNTNIGQKKYTINHLETWVLMTNSASCL